MTNELLERCNSCVQLASTKWTLVGNTNVVFSEDDYSEMLDYVSDLFKGYKYYSRKDDSLVFITLVEIARRWKSSDSVGDIDSGFWYYVYKTLFGWNEVDQNIQKIRNDFIKIINRLDIPVVQTGQKYYATVMMHAFAPHSSLCSFFELCYSVFKKDLDYGFTVDDEWIGEIIAEQLRSVLEGQGEDKVVSIGSSVYSIKIGLRSFAIHPDLQDDFEKFIIDTLYSINKLYYKEIVREKTWVDRCVLNWWRSRFENEKRLVEGGKGKRASAVTKDNIIVRYRRNDRDVAICIPPIRLDDDYGTMMLFVEAGGVEVYREEMRTKRGELVTTTKQIELDLNQLLENSSSVNIRVWVKEDDAVIYDSKESLNREFVLFEDENEVYSNTLTPSNYFVFALDIDKIKTPDECHGYSRHLYNIYPRVGEMLSGNYRQIVFVDKRKTSYFGKKVCLVGNIADVDWRNDKTVYNVFNSNMSLVVPKEHNLKALELRVDDNVYKLSDLSKVDFDDYYQFNLQKIIPISRPIIVALFSYSKEESILREDVIVFHDFEIHFNKPYYYGEMVRKVSICHDGIKDELTWSNQDDEVYYAYNEGLLEIKIPQFRWRIGEKEWHTGPILGEKWCKEIVTNGDLLELDYPLDENKLKLFVNRVELQRNHFGRYELGRTIYAKADGSNVVVAISDNIYKELILFKISMVEHFVDNPLFYNDGKVYWRVEETFIGEKNRLFLVEIGNNIVETNGLDRVLFDNLREDKYRAIVKAKNKNIFAKETHLVLYEGDLIVGYPEQFRFKNKYIRIISISPSFRTETSTWELLNKNYLITNLVYFQKEEEEGVCHYYLGKLMVERGGKFKDIDDLNLTNERGVVEKINPVRIELRSNNTLWLLAGYNIDDDCDFLGELIFDKKEGCICNINAKNPGSSVLERFIVINLYKFKEDNYV